MGIFRQLHKSAFWSQFLLGMVAILSLPETQAVTSLAQPNTIQQSYNLSELVSTQQVEKKQTRFLSLISPKSHNEKQAVTFCKMFATTYRLQASPPPPIRAGPLV